MNFELLTRIFRISIKLTFSLTYMCLYMYINACVHKWTSIKLEKVSRIFIFIILQSYVYTLSLHAPKHVHTYRYSMCTNERTYVKLFHAHRRMYTQKQKTKKRDTSNPSFESFRVVKAVVRMSRKPVGFLSDMIKYWSLGRNTNWKHTYIKGFL